jgi:ketosteroid isomerase-like protein
VSANRDDLIGSLEREWRDALCAKDMERLRALIHPRFVLIGTRASGPFTMDREGWLEAIQRRELVSIDLEIADAAIFDQVLVATVRAEWRVKYLGREVDDCVLLSDVWVLDEGRWRVVRRHSSPAPPDSC